MIMGGYLFRQARVLSGPHSPSEGRSACPEVI